MKKIALTISFLVFALLIIPRTLSAQESTETDYEKLGEEWMETMMGDSHEEADEQMRQMMGEDFLRQMHIAMGKRAQSPGSFGMMPILALSGAGGMGMMGGWNMMGGLQQTGLASGFKAPFLGVHYVLALITWI